MFPGIIAMPLLLLGAAFWKSVTINRTAFHIALLDEIKTYLGELSNESNAELRGNFPKKMDFTAEGGE
jgi:hypothetical protein